MEDCALINGYRGALIYNKTFVQIYYQNIAKGRNNFFKDNNEANFSLSRNAFSVLKFIDDEFKIDDVFEFILYYEELKTIIHWSQEVSFHMKVKQTGYRPLHVDDDILYFGGLAVNTIASSSYLDGMPNSDEWWYSIGSRGLSSYNKRSGFPGPIYTLRTEVNVSSLWIRIDNFKLMRKLPFLLRKFSCKCSIRSNNYFLLLMIFILSY